MRNEISDDEQAHACHRKVPGLVWSTGRRDPIDRLRKPIGQREGLQALVVSAKRSQAESIALLSSLGVAPR